MEAELNYHNEFVNSDTQTLNDIYQQISVSFNDEFDYENEINDLYELMDKCFDKQIKQIDSDKLISDIGFFNNNIVKYIKYCFDNNHRKINYIFIVFCDYYDLNYNKVFQILHPKIKDLLKKSYIKMVGKKEYLLQKNKYEVKKDYHQQTLFDLIK